MNTPAIPTAPLRLIQTKKNSTRLHLGDNSASSIGTLYLNDYGARSVNPKLAALAKVIVQAPELLRLLAIVEQRCPIDPTQNGNTGGTAYLTAHEIAAIRAALTAAGCTQRKTLAVICAEVIQAWHTWDTADNPAFEAIVAELEAAPAEISELYGASRRFLHHYQNGSDMEQAIASLKAALP